MTDSPFSLRSGTALKAVAPLLQFFGQSRWSKRFGNPMNCDFTIGNPHEMPGPGYVDALSRSVTPKDSYWFAYKLNEEEARNAVATSLQKWRNTAFDPQDIFLTNGATGALAVVMHTILDPGDQVIYLSPSWFLYEAMILNTGAVPVRVKTLPDSFDLDVPAIEAALTDKTRAVIVNSPNNPSGRIYSGEQLRLLGEVIAEASRRNGRTVYLISDEAYARIVFDGRPYPSPAACYDNSFLVYTYGKTLLTPGQRIGYIALPPRMPDRPLLREAILSQQMLNSWAFPNALMQHALPDLEQIQFDIEALQRKRDRMVKALREVGYRCNVPEGTFYCMVRSPLPDDRVFVEMLAERDVYCIPGSLQGADGYFRISLTATDDMIKRSLPIFAEVLKRAEIR
jgi:aspartate aminotransferase